LCTTPVKADATAEATVDQIMNKLDAYLGQLKENGMKLPRHADCRKPHFRAICAAANIDFKFITEQRYKNRIALAVEEIGFDTDGKLQLAKRREQDAALLAIYLQDLKSKGLKLPEDPAKWGKVFYAQVEEEAGLSSRLLTNSGKLSSYIIRIIEDAVSALGTEVRILRSSELTDSRVTYKQLLESGTAERKQELKGRRGARQQLYNTRWGLKFFRNSLNLDQGAPIGQELFDEFTPHLHTVLAKVTSNDTRKKVQTEALWWSDYYKKLLKTQAMPEDITGAIAHLIDASGLSLALISRLIGISRANLERWYRGQSMPSMLGRHYLIRMETLFKLPTGTLLSRIPRWNRRRYFRTSDLPEFLRDNHRLAKRVVHHLPENFCQLPLEQQHEIVDDVSRNIVGYDNDYTRRVSELTKLEYRLKEITGPLCEELGEFSSFKADERPPLGMRRNRKWRKTTKEKNDREMGYFFGALRLPQDAEEPRLCGLGIPIEHLTMAFISCPMMVDWYLRYRGQVRTQYTSYQLNLLGKYIEMLQPTTGWLRQKPQLASRLTPVLIGDVALVSPEFITRARKDWDGVCDQAIEQYQALRIELRPLVKISRDPFNRIEGIVDMDDPIQAIRMLVEGMRQDWPSVKTAPMRHHITVRNTAIVLLIAVTSFRRHTVSQLDYTGDNSSQIFMSGDKYVLNVPRYLFKEEDSPFFGPKGSQTDYFMEVPDVYGFNEVLTEYLRESRPWLLEHYHSGCKENPLFVSSGLSKIARLSDRRISDIYYSATEIHLVENKWRDTGLQKVGRHGPHSARHIRGTTIMKKTGSAQLAGDANHNSEHTARTHYTRFVSKDRNRRVNDTLFGDD
jgi:hypothetical protein